MLTTLTPPLALPQYAASLFVNRHDEIALVTDLLDALVTGETPPARTLVFEGIRGSGKTWLALHLMRAILPQHPHVTSALISLVPPEAHLRPMPEEWFAPSDFLEHQPQEAATLLARWVAQRWGTIYPPDATPAEIADWIARDVNIACDERAVVLIIDALYDADADLLAALETCLLHPLAALPRVALIFTGARSWYPWESEALRIALHERPLSPFGLESTRAQLARQATGLEHLAHHIHAQGGGHPLSTVLLARGQLDTLRQTVEVLLTDLPDNNRELLRGALEALAPLQHFDEDLLRDLLALYFNDPLYRLWPTAKLNAVRTQLNECHLVYWRPQHGHVIDPAVRHALDYHLRVTHPALWRTIHEHAYAFYHEWALRAHKPNQRDYFAAQAEYHAAALLTGLPPEERTTA